MMSASCLAPPFLANAWSFASLHLYLWDNTQVSSFFRAIYRCRQMQDGDVCPYLHFS